MNDRTTRKLAKAIGWRARRISSRAINEECRWSLKTHESTRYYESDALIAHDVELNVLDCWCNDWASEHLVDILEDSMHAQHEAVRAWYGRQNEYAEREAWSLASDEIFIPNEPPPLQWDDATLARLAPDFARHGVLLRAVARKRAQRSAKGLMCVLVDGKGASPRRIRL